MASRVFVAAIVVVSFIASSYAASEADVPSLTKDTFDKAISGDLTLVKFFAPWCGHCKSMKTDYEEAAAALKGKAVLAEVDATIEKEIAGKYNIQGFPTLKLFAGGEMLSEYRGARDKDSFIKFIERAMLPSVEELKDAAAADAFVEQNKGKVIYISTKLDKLASKFKKESMSLRDSIPDGVAFGAVPDAASLKNLKGSATVEDTDYVLALMDDDSTDSYTGDEDGLQKFIQTTSIPLLGELSRGNAQVYTELNLPIFVLFQDPKNKNVAVMEEIRELSRSYRGTGKLAFAWIDFVELKTFADHLGVGDKKIPIAIYEFESDVKYVYEKDYAKDDVVAWVKEFAEGKLLPTKKSEKIPEKNDEPVKVVVGDSWTDIVEDESKDVLIEQYAPWCGHCKSLAPVLDEVATSLKDVETIVIAKMDATVNDAPAEYKAKGFPTMHFFPAGSKKGIEFTDGRKFNDFIDFLTKHATHKFKAPEKKEETEKASDAEEAAKEGGEKDEL